MMQNDENDKAIDQFVTKLSAESKMLIVLKAQLYDGKWEYMIDDLKNRLTGKPYIFKLANRINDDVQRIEEIQNFENEYEVDLANYVEL